MYASLVLTDRENPFLFGVIFYLYNNGDVMTICLDLVYSFALCHYKVITAISPAEESVLFSA